jgi:polyhydroxybutyrate depolymerase
MQSIYTKFKLGLILVALLPLQLFAQQTITGSIQHDGMTRDYRLYLPAGYDANNPPPLVFNLHGFGSNALEQELYSTMNLVADTANFLVCYANGVDNSWNVGWNFGTNTDDVSFINALIDTFITNYNVDPNRVYSCGMSNGGFMSYRLACELNDRIAAIASVTGSFSPQFYPQCNPGRAVPVMEIHGTADDVVFYGGTPNVSIHMDTVIQFWAQNNACNLVADTTAVPDINQADNCTASRIDFNDCDNDAMVSFYKIQGGGHTWPGALFSIGTTNQDINASVEIWRFFNRFTLDGAVSTEEEVNPEETVQVFPNPAQDFLQLSTNDYEHYEIYNIKGQRLSQGALNQNTVDIHNLVSGMYYLSLSNEKKRIHLPFVKQ